MNRTISGSIFIPCFEHFSATACRVLPGYSKTSLPQASRTALRALAGSAGLEAKREVMFTGAALDSIENRAVLQHGFARLREG